MLSEPCSHHRLIDGATAFHISHPGIIGRFLFIRPAVAQLVNQDITFSALYHVLYVQMWEIIRSRVLHSEITANASLVSCCHTTHIQHGCKVVHRGYGGLTCSICFLQLPLVAWTNGEIFAVSFTVAMFNHRNGRSFVMIHGQQHIPLHACVVTNKVPKLFYTQAQWIRQARAAASGLWPAAETI